MLQTNRVVALIAAATAVGACSPADEESQKARVTEFAPGLEQHPTAAWECDSTGYIVTELNNDNSIWLYVPGQTVRLNPAVTDTDFDFGDKRMGVSVAGDHAVLTLDGSNENCLRNARASITEDARLRGVSFRGTGNEPPWTLEIGPEEIVLLTGYDSERHAFPLTEPVLIDSGNASRFVSRNDLQDIDILISANGCSDSMSGEKFASRINVTMAGTSLQGCGNPLR